MSITPVISVVIDGIPLAGKTTLIENLKKLKDVDSNNQKQQACIYNFFKEPVESWIDEGWLEKYYSNIQKFASSFQARVILSHIEQRNHIETINLSNSDSLKIVNICERSAITTLEVFSSMLFNDGVLDEIEIRLHQQMIEMFKYKRPDILIYLDIDPEVAFNRNIKRMRKGESNIQLEYLCKLKNAYLSNLSKLANKIIIIDGSDDELTILNKIIEIFDKI
jgi:thymidylate kinase